MPNIETMESDFHLMIRDKPVLGEDDYTRISNRVAIYINHIRDYQFVNIKYDFLEKDNIKNVLKEGYFTISEGKYYELLNEDEFINYLKWNLNLHYE